MTLTLTAELEEWLGRLMLDSGSHAQANGEACVMEAVSYVAGEPPWGNRYNAAYNAAYAVFKPAYEEKLGDINKGLQASALLLLDRLIDVSAKVAA